MYADHKHIDPRLNRTKRLMMVTPDFLTTNQSEECPRADWAPCDPVPHPVFRTAPCRLSGSLGLWNISCLLSLLDTCNKHCPSLHHALVSGGWLCWVQVSGPKFGSVMPRTLAWNKSQRGRWQRNQVRGGSSREEMVVGSMEDTFWGAGMTREGAGLAPGEGL